MSYLESKMGYEFEKGPKANIWPFQQNILHIKHMETHFQQTCKILIMT